MALAGPSSWRSVPLTAFAPRPIAIEFGPFVIESTPKATEPTPNAHAEAPMAVALSFAIAVVPTATAKLASSIKLKSVSVALAACASVPTATLLSPAEAARPHAKRPSSPPPSAAPAVPLAELLPLVLKTQVSACAGVADTKSAAAKAAAAEDR